MVNLTPAEYVAWSPDQRADEIAIRTILRAAIVKKRGYVRAAVTRARTKYDDLFVRIDPLTTGRSWTAVEYSIIVFQKKLLIDTTHELASLNDEIIELMAEGLYPEPEIETELAEIDLYNDRKWELVSILEGFILEQQKDNEANRRRLATPTTTPVRAGTAPPTGGLGSTAKVKYPTLARPEFWGDIVDWPPFWDSWKINYDGNRDFNEVQKLEYLKQSLKGPALDTIKHLTLIGTNYQIAMDTLEKKYADKRKIIARHFEAIVNIPACKGESASQLRRLSETFAMNVQGLSNQGIVCADPFTAIIFESRLD
jgi:hypothetical protein